MRRPLASLAAAAVAAAALLAASPAAASPAIRYGVQDDAWIAYGSGGSLADRLAALDTLGVDVVRYTLRWNEVARTRPANARDPEDPAYDWTLPDEILRGLAAHGIAPLVTIWGTPGWANGGRTANWAPSTASDFADFAYAAASRYRFVTRWTIWNEPNQRISLRPTVPATYVRTLLNPGYAAIKEADPRASVAGGVTAPRGNVGGVAPLDWIRGMAAAGARLDVYAHNPYPLNPGAETPTSGGCDHCATATMATLGRLIATVRRDLHVDRIWLTEYGYQTNPPDDLLGVSPALQARYEGEAALRAWRAPGVEILIHFMVRDDGADAQGGTGYWQSGLEWANGKRKPAWNAFALPLAEDGRAGARTTLWGQVRPRSGPQPYVLQVRRGGSWVALGGARTTGPGGTFRISVDAARGMLVRLWSPRDSLASPPLVVS